MNASKLKEFVPRAFEALGAVVEMPDHETLDVLLPSQWVSHFENREFLSIPLTDPRFQVGSVWLEKLIDAQSERGFLARAYLNPLRLEVSGLDEKLGRQFHFVDLRHNVQGQSAEETAHVLFQYKVAYLTDDKEERLHTVAIHLATLLEHERLMVEDRENGLFLDAERTYAEMPGHAIPPLEKIKPILEAVLHRTTMEEVRTIAAIQKKFLAREIERIERYFETLLQELEEKEARLFENAEALRRLQDRRKAIELDRQKKRLDVCGKFRLEVKTRLINALIVLQPCVRTEVAFQNRTSKISRSFYWDPIFKQFMPVPCDHCHQSTTTFGLDADRLLCAPCRR